MNNNMQMNPHEFQGDYQPDQIKGLCKQYMNYHVIGQLSDGSQVDGIIDSMDEEAVIMLVPEEVDAEQMNRQFEYGYDYNYDYDDYGRPRRRRFRRFRRQRFPFRFFRRLFRYPYYYPPLSLVRIRRRILLIATFNGDLRQFKCCLLIWSCTKPYFRK